jgi:hypothetical protein
MRAARRWMVAAMLASLAVPVIAFVEEMGRVRDLARVIAISAKIRDDPQMPEHARQMAEHLSGLSGAFEMPMVTMTLGALSFALLGVALWMTRARK